MFACFQHRHCRCKSSIQMSLMETISGQSPYNSSAMTIFNKYLETSITSGLILLSSRKTYIILYLVSNILIHIISRDLQKYLMTECEHLITHVPQFYTPESPNPKSHNLHSHNLQRHNLQSHNPQSHTSLSHTLPSVTHFPQSHRPQSHNPQ